MGEEVDLCGSHQFHAATRTDEVKLVVYMKVTKALFFQCGEATKRKHHSFPMDPHTF